jgi:hypothetical protein
MVARIIYNDGANSFLCSGTVVSSNVILTAGHCAVDTSTGITDAASNYEVLTGTQSEGIAGQVSGVSQVIPYPSFDPSSLWGDAALLVLATPTTVTPVALATEPMDGYLYDAGTETAITGWGVYDSNDDLPTELMYGYDVVQSPGYCSQQIADMNGSFDSSTQLCAVDASSYADGTCHGDSGGPILSFTNEWVEIGVTSFGPDNCDTAQPAVFTRSDAYESWIAGEVAANPPSAPAPSPSPAPAPAPNPAPATLRPKAGVYRGRTTQHQGMSAQVEANQTTLTDIRIGFVLRCTRHRDLRYNLSSVARIHDTSADSLKFNIRFRDPTGTRYWFAGQFSPGGSAFGTLRATWWTRHYGFCSTGRIAWWAAI